MYCILNQSDDIIAADLEFLKLFETDDLVKLYKKITSGDAKISLEDKKVTIINKENKNEYDIKVTPITTLFGKSTMIELLNEEIKAPDFNVVPNVAIEKVESLAEMIEPVQEEEKAIIEHEHELENIEIEEKENSELKYFINTKIGLDIPEVAKQMNLSEKDYKTFLNEYIDSIDKFKKDLKSKDIEAKTNALNFIKHVTVALHLPQEMLNLVNELNENSSKELMQNFFDTVEGLKEKSSHIEAMPKIEKEEAAILETGGATEKKEPKKEAMEEFGLNIFEAEQPIKEIGIAEQVVQPANVALDEIKIDLSTENIAPVKEIEIGQPKNELEINVAGIAPIETTPVAIPEELKAEAEEPIKKSETVKKSLIDLSKIKPQPFDFILEESAKELSLPVDIVKEFIKDFIEQCHSDTEKIIHRFEEGDMEKIKKLAHSLKGVSSNLYILPLAATLEELQNNDDLSQVKPLVEKYWGQFLYLENIISSI